MQHPLTLKLLTPPKEDDRQVRDTIQQMMGRAVSSGF